MMNYFVLLKKTENYTIELRGLSFTKSEFDHIAQGSEKHVYKLKQQNLCFFLPHKVAIENWENFIKAEKYVSDELIKLGFRAQEFQIENLTIKLSGKSPLTVPVLVCQDFTSLCADRSLVIYDPKGDTKIHGRPPVLYANKQRMKDKVFMQKMLSSAINEFAIAMTFSLPISAVKIVDDSEHFCMDTSVEPPVIHYMFWDVASDYTPNLPVIPTLKTLREGVNAQRFRKPIDSFANGLAAAIAAFGFDEIKRELQEGETFFEKDRNFFYEVENNIKTVLDDDFLQAAIEHARQTTIVWFKEFILISREQVKEDPLSEDGYKELFVSVISTSSLELLNECLAVFGPVPQAHLEGLIELAKIYQCQAVTDRLHALQVQPTAAPAKDTPAANTRFSVALNYGLLISGIGLISFSAVMFSPKIAVVLGMNLSPMILLGIAACALLLLSIALYRLCHTPNAATRLPRNTSPAPATCVQNLYQNSVRFFHSIMRTTGLSVANPEVPVYQLGPE